MGSQRSSRLGVLLIVGLALLLGGRVPFAKERAAEPKGQLVIAVDFSITPSWFDPAETQAITTPLVFLYALHDALLKPLPRRVMAPTLAESWTESEDGLEYEFKLREGVSFVNGDPFTAEDVKFSFERYKGASAALLREKVKAVEVVGPSRVRFRLKEPWPDFLAYYGTPATGAAWVVPKRYVEEVGEEGFQKHPIGLGPYKFVRFQPGVELVVEANERYWRKVPQVKRLIFKGVPEHSTRLAMVKTGEADISFGMTGPQTREVLRDPRLRLAKALPAVVGFLSFPEQFDPNSPWHDRRVRMAAAQAVDMQAISDAERLGMAPLTGSIVSRELAFALPFKPYPYEPEQARRLLAEAGYPDGFEAGDLTPIPPQYSLGEAVINYLAAVGIKTKLRAMERAPFFTAWREKKLTGVIVGPAAMMGNAATRIEAFAVSGGYYAAGGYPDIDALFQQQASEGDRLKREALLHEIQRRIHDRVMFAPIYDVAVLHAVGPRVEEAAVGITPLLFFPAPYEAMRLKE
ncbi:MAG: ABC transporter substrate-binding protein [Candidatus Entotheonellia bacterium]